MREEIGLVCLRYKHAKKVLRKGRFDAVISAYQASHTPLHW